MHVMILEINKKYVRPWSLGIAEEVSKLILNLGGEKLVPTKKDGKSWENHWLFSWLASWMPSCEAALCLLSPDRLCFHSQFTRELGKLLGLGVPLFIRHVMFEREFGPSLEDLAQGKERPGFSGTSRQVVPMEK